MNELNQQSTTSAEENQVENSTGNQTQKIEMVYALFNQFLFQEAKNNIELIEYFYQTDYDTSGNSLIRELLHAVRTYSLESLDAPMFKSIMIKLGKTDAEASSIISSIAKWKGYNKVQIKPYLDTLRQILASALIARGKSRYGNDPSAYLDYLKRSELKLEFSDSLSTVSFSEMDINSIVASTGDVIQTGIDWLDSSFGKKGTQYYGVPTHQTVLISCPPGTGKTMFMMNIALNITTNPVKPARCHYLAMGDMMESDFINRLGSIATGLSMEVVKTNLKQSYLNLSAIIGDRLGVSIVPSAKLSADEYVEAMKDSDYDVLFIDYDSNFKSDASDNMYLEYGKIYDRLTELTMRGKLVFIAAQPKAQSWDVVKAKSDVIEMDMIGESARKVHSVDVAITGSRATDFGNSGIFKIVKNRRGKNSIVSGYIRLNNGRFKYIPRDLFNYLRTTDTSEWSESQVDDALFAYKQSTGNGGLSGAGMNTASGGASTINNPFGAKSNRP